MNPKIVNFLSILFNRKCPLNTTARFSQSCREVFNHVILRHFRPKYFSVLLFVEEEIVFRRVVRPNILDRFVYFTLVFYFLQVFKYFERRTRTYCVVNQLIFRCGPRSILELRCQFKCPVHNLNVFKFPNVNGLAPNFNCRSAVTDLQKYKKNEKNKEKIIKHRHTGINTL